MHRARLPLHTVAPLPPGAPRRAALPRCPTPLTPRTPRAALIAPRVPPRPHRGQTRGISVLKFSKKEPVRNRAGSRRPYEFARAALALRWWRRARRWWRRWRRPCLPDAEATIVPPVAGLPEFSLANTEPEPNASVRTSAVASPSFFIIFNASPSEGLLKRFRFGPAEGRVPAVPLLLSPTHSATNVPARAGAPRPVFPSLSPLRRARTLPRRCGGLESETQTPQ